MFRQGDVLIIPRPDLKDLDGEAPTGEKLIIAEGEVTGHCHSIPSAAVAATAVTAMGLLIRLKETTQLVHDEHAPIVLSPGCYEVRIQQEYGPQGWRRVTD